MGGWRTTPSSSSGAKSRWPRTAASCDVAASSERPVRSPAKMMWTTWRAAKLFTGCDRVDDRDRPLEDEVRRPRPPPRAARVVAPRRGSRPELTPPPGSSQYSFPGFSCRQSSSRSCQRSAAETRMRGSAAITTADDPNPRSPRSLSGRASTSTVSTSGEPEQDELRYPHPRLDRERLARSRC